MSVDPASNNLIQLSGDNALTKEGAQNISKALTSFAQNHAVPQSISKLDTIQPRTVTSVDTSSAKSFFDSLAQAICDVCHNIRAFFSQSDETILGIARPTENLLEILRQYRGKIKNLFDEKSSPEDAGKLRKACDMLQKTYDELGKKLDNGNRNDYNLAGDGRKVLEEIRNNMDRALEILKPNSKEQFYHDTHQTLNNIRQGLQKAENFLENVAKKNTHPSEKESQ